MKIIHTADWHLGQTFFEFPRTQEHTHFLKWLREKVKENEADLLLIAGDIFDTQNPSAEAQTMFYSFLRDITTENSTLQIIIIAGNHDSAARLEAPAKLLEVFNVSVRGVVKHTTDGEIDLDDLIIPLHNGGYCLAVPFLRQGDYPKAETYAEGVKTLYTQLYDKVKGNSPIIAMGHLQATGSEISNSDRSERANKTIIGGLECITPDSFDADIAYTALGHLHRAQRVSGRDNVRYAGAPLPMSFAEKNNKQGVTLVTINDDNDVDIERIEYDSIVKLISIPSQPQPLIQVLEEIKALEDGEITSFSPMLEVKVLITEPEPSLRTQIEKALEGKSVRLARIEASTNCIEGETKQVITYEELKNIDPRDMATDIFKRRYGGETMPEIMIKMLNEVIEEVSK